MRPLERCWKSPLGLIFHCWLVEPLQARTERNLPISEPPLVSGGRSRQTDWSWKLRNSAKPLTLSVLIQR